MLTTESVYALVQQKSRSHEIGKAKAFDWTELRTELEHMGHSQNDVALIEAAEYLRPILESGLLVQAIQTGFLAAGIKPSQMAGTVGYIRTYALPANQVQAIVENAALALQNMNLPNIAIENMGAIAEIQRKHKISPANYQHLSELVHSSDPSAQTKLRLGILGVLTHGEAGFLKNIGSIGFWRSRELRRAAKDLGQVESPNRTIEPLRIKPELTQLVKYYAAIPKKSIYDKRALLDQLENFVSKEESISTDDLALILEQIPIGVNWGHSEYNYKTGWLQVAYTGFDPVDLRVICTALKKVQIRTSVNVEKLRDQFLLRLKNTYKWRGAGEGFKNDVYGLVQSQFLRIFKLKVLQTAP